MTQLLHRDPRHARGILSCSAEPHAGDADNVPAHISREV